MLKWVFGADTSPFRRSLNEMRNDVQSFAGTAKGHIAGMFAGAAVVSAAKAIIDHFARIKDLADRFGESAESIQRIGAAAEQAGMDTETIAKALTIATKNAVEAASAGGDLAESFARLGINAGEFANMPIEEKLKALNAGYNGNTNSAQALADTMKILGKAGAEAIPLISQGQEELQDQLDNTIVASEGTVAAIARFDDQIASLKNTSMVVGAAIFGSFSFAFGAIGMIIGAFYGNTVRSFEMMVDVATSAGAVIGNALTGDFEGAKAAAARFGQAIKDGVGGNFNEIKDTAEEVGKLFDETFGGSGGVSEGGPNIDNLKETAEATKKIEEERKKLVADIAKMEEEARIKSLSLAEKILDAEKRRAELAADNLFGADEDKALEARKGQLEVEKEIAGYRKEQGEIDKKATEEKQDLIEKNAAEMVKLAEKSVELDRNNKLAGMSDKDKQAMFKKERAQALKDEKDANNRGDYKGGLEAGNKAKELTGQIDEITRGIADKAKDDLKSLQGRGPTIATSSLADIGGGGGARMMESDYGRKTVDLLAIIAANTAGGSEGSKPPEPI